MLSSSRAALTCVRKRRAIGEKTCCRCQMRYVGDSRAGHSGLRTRTVAERGFLTIAFDPGHAGESSGVPRHTATSDKHVLEMVVVNVPGDGHRRLWSPSPSPNPTDTPLDAPCPTNYNKHGC